ncbi:Heat-inducible transcription repressor HrcA [Streptomyces californicus]
MLSERRLEVLRAIVQDYVGTEEPVGSKALTERHQLGVSPATVRNDMAVLEEEGFIAQPHTSAGRIPTTRGTASSSTGSRASSRSPRPSAGPSRTSSTARSTSTTSSAGRYGCSRSSPGRSPSCSTPR